MTTGAAPTWGQLLDRLEERLRRIEASAETGPPAGPGDVPDGPPSESERLRLLALLAAHDQLIARLEGRRRSLRQAQHYRLGAA